MAQERVVPVKRFVAVDGDGRAFHIVGSQRVLVDGSGGAARETISMSLRTTEGFAVKRLSKGEYEVEIVGPAGTQRTVRATSTEAEAP